MDEFKDYERKLIPLSNNTAMLIHLFYKDEDHRFEDIFIPDICDKVHEVSFYVYKEAAEQLIKQLEGRWCIAFCKALRDKCNELIKEDEERIKKN